MDTRLVHLKWSFADQIADLTTATTAIRDHISSEDFDPSTPRSIYYFRMCATSLIVSLAKLWEAISHYGREINQFPPDARDEVIRIKNEIEQRKIYQFRSKYAAHIIDKDTKQPISLAEGEKRYKAIVGDTLGDLIAFCDWICPESYANQKGCVMSAVIGARDHCLSVVGPCTQRP